MKHPPPKIVRRLVIAPAVLLGSLTLVAFAPLLLAAALAGDAYRRHGSGLTRITAFALVFLAAEAGMIAALFILWIGSGLGLLTRKRPVQDAYYLAMRIWLRCLSTGAIHLLGLRIVIVDPAKPRPGPLLVFGRHAGFGDALMLVRTLMLAYKRRPRVVMLGFLQWDPTIDLIAHRLPNLFIEHHPQQADEFVRRIGALATGMDDRDALVLYPEGALFAEQKRQRAIARLRERGQFTAAEAAEAMDRVLPPRYRGPLAAILAAPQADVVLVAHTALEELGSLKQLYRRLPLRRPIKARYWRIPAADVPRERDTLIAWLFDWWRTIDTWVTEQSDPHDGGTDRG